MEVIRLSGYIRGQGPDCLALPDTPGPEANGLPRGHVSIAKPVLVEIANGWAREAGVRNLEKRINRIMRRIAWEYVSGQDGPVSITSGDLRSILVSPCSAKKGPQAGSPWLALGLAWTSMGRCPDH